MKRIVDRELNLLSGIVYSVNKRGVKRWDLDMEEFREIFFFFLFFVWIEYILFINSEVLSDVMKRGLISIFLLDMFFIIEGGKLNVWLW